jgi:hypothetical protein
MGGSETDSDDRRLWVMTVACPAPTNCDAVNHQFRSTYRAAMFLRLRCAAISIELVLRSH